MRASEVPRSDQAMSSKMRGAEKVSAEERIRAARETVAAKIRPKRRTGPQTDHRFGSTKGSPESDSNRRPLPYHRPKGGSSGAHQDIEGRTLRASEDSDDLAVSTSYGPKAAR